MHTRVVVAHASNPSTQEAEAGRSLSLRPAWSTRQIIEQSALLTQRNPVSKKKLKKQKLIDLVESTRSNYLSRHSPRPTRGASLIQVFFKQTKLTVKIISPISLLCQVLDNLDSHLKKSEYFRFLWFPHSENVSIIYQDHTNKVSAVRAQPGPASRSRGLLVTIVLTVHPQRIPHTLPIPG